MSDILTKAIAETNKYIDMANEKYGMNLTYPAVSLNLKGKVAGRAFYASNLVKYNKDLMVANEAEFFARTIPHEVAHIVAWHKYDKIIKPHGSEWKRVMIDFEVKDISRCHSYDTTASSIVRDKYTYICNCMEHKVSSIMHRRIVQGDRIYRCKLCKNRIVLKNCLTNINVFANVS